MSSLRWRISLSFAAVAAGVAALIGVLVYEQSVADRIGRERALQAQAVRLAASLYATGRQLPAGASLDDPRAPVTLVRVVRAGALATDVEADEVWAGAPVDGGLVFVHASRAEDRRALAVLRGTLISVGALATVAGALVGLVLAARLSQRLRTAAAGARRIEAGDLDARVAAAGRDEVAVLAKAIDGMAGSLKQRIEREQRFAADVAHELRTPLAGLVSAVGLLEEGRATDLVRRSAQRLRGLVEDLLEIARLESGAERPDRRWVDLGRFTRDVAAPYHAAVEDGEGLRVMTDPRRLERVLVNLLENAHRHGAPPVTVRLGPDRLEVLDRGPGFSDEMLQSATERFTAGSTARDRGTGLGLAIASGQAEVLSARLELRNREHGGAAVAIVFGSQPEQPHEGPAG